MLMSLLTFLLSPLGGMESGRFQDRNLSHTCASCSAVRARFSQWLRHSTHFCEHAPSFPPAISCQGAFAPLHKLHGTKWRRSSCWEYWATHCRLRKHTQRTFESGHRRNRPRFGLAPLAIAASTIGNHNIYSYFYFFHSFSVSSVTSYIFLYSRRLWTDEDDKYRYN